MEAGVASDTRKLVSVTLAVTKEDGETEIVEAGRTPVTQLKQELGVPENCVLWVIEKDGRPKPLGDHEHFDVKAGDHFVALVKGGVS